SARAAPSRTTEASARSPSVRARASTRMDLPAPVSPENTVKPGPKSISAVSTITKSRMCRVRSMYRRKRRVSELVSASGLVETFVGITPRRHAVPVQFLAQRGVVAVAYGVQNADAVGGTLNLNLIAFCEL